METIRRILAVSWMTRCCEKSILYGISLAQKYQADLIVAHIVNSLWTEGWNLPMISILEERKRDLDRIRHDLEQVVEKGKQSGVAIRELVREGDPEEAILQAIREENVDLVILRAHEEGRIERFLIGGSNDAIIRKMPCSILLVKS